MDGILRKTFLVYIILSVVLLLTACNKKIDEFDTTISIGTIAGDETYNDMGVFNSEDGIVYYCDPNTGIRTPICTKINCDHQGISPTNPSPECDAYFSTFVNCTAIVGDSFYCVTCPEDQGFYNKEFIKSDKNGTNRKVLYKTDSVSIFSSGIYEDGYLVYSYYNQDDKDGNRLEKNQIGMIIINLQNEEVTRIELQDSYSGKILTANVDDGKVYYMLSYNTENISDYDYDYIVSDEGKEKLKDISRIEIWKYDMESGEKSLFDTKGEDATEYCLGFGYLLKGYENNDKIEMTELKTGKKIMINNTGINSVNICMFDDGVLFSHDGMIQMCRYGTDHLENIGSYPEKHLSISWVSDNWVYGARETANGFQNCVCAKKDFMSGHFNWKELSLFNSASDSSDMETEEIETVNNDDITDVPNEIFIQSELHQDHPDDYYIHWVVPEMGAAIKEEYVEKVNEKLEKDGYDFGIKIVRVRETFDTDEYEEGIYKYADIAFTGMQMNGKNLAETMVADGKLFDFTDMAKKSPYFTQMNPLIRESVTINGGMYHFPNEMAQDGTQLCLLSDVIEASQGSFIHDNASEMVKYVSEKSRLYYGWQGLDFVRWIGYDYDAARGIVADKDGNIVNPFEDKKCVEFMDRINAWYRTGLATNINKESVKADCAILLTYDSNAKDYNRREICSWQVKMCKRILSSTVILADSDKKEKAFKLLELLRTDHDYGNLIVYGHTESQNPDEEPPASNIKWIYGLDDGLFRAEEKSNHFMSVEERNDFYNKNVEASVTLYMNLPFECTELKNIVEKYLGYSGNILFCDDYEERLEIFKEEYTKKLETVLEKMGK